MEVFAWNCKPWQRLNAVLQEKSFFLLFSFTVKRHSHQVLSTAPQSSRLQSSLLGWGLPLCQFLFWGCDHQVIYCIVELCTGWFLMIYFIPVQGNTRFTVGGDRLTQPFLIQACRIPNRPQPKSSTALYDSTTIPNDSVMCDSLYLAFPAAVQEFGEESHLSSPFFPSSLPTPLLLSSLLSSSGRSGISLLQQVTSRRLCDPPSLSCRRAWEPHVRC